MRNFARFFIIINLLSCRAIFAQEIRYTISAELNKQAVSIDSILIENLSNNTSLWFKNLPVQNEYIINLTLKKLEVTTGVYNNSAEEPYSILKNYPGLLTIACAPGFSENVNISVFNIQGKEVFSSLSLPVLKGNTIDIKIGATGMYMIRVSSESGFRTFKAVGFSGDGHFDISTGQSWSSDNEGHKKSQNLTNGDFDFIQGDSLRISVFKKTCYTRPADLVIINSQPLLFSLKESTVESYGVSDAFKIISPAVQQSLTFEPISGQIRFPLPSDLEMVPLVGEIIAIDNDTTGFLRKIISVLEENGNVILESKPAYLNEVFVDMVLNLDTKLREARSPNAKSGSSGEVFNSLTDEKGYIHPVEVLYFKKDGTISRRNAFSSSKGPEGTVPLINFQHDLTGKDIYGYQGGSVHFYVGEGDVSLKADAVFNLDFKYNGTLDPQTKVRIGDLEQFSYLLNSKAGFRTKLALDLFSPFTISTEDPEKLLDLASVTARFLVPPGIPVWITFGCDIYGSYNISGDASLNADWGFAKSDSIITGGTYTSDTDEFIPHSEVWPVKSVYPFHADGEVNATARFELFPKVDIKFYSFIGPYAEIVPFVSGFFSSKKQTFPDAASYGNLLAWNSGINVGLDLRLGAELSFLGLIDKKLGPLVINSFDEPLWRSPKILSALTIPPDYVHVSSSHTILYKVTDNLGFPVPLCPVSFTGDGYVADPVVITDSLGMAATTWTAPDVQGFNKINTTIYNADMSVITANEITVAVHEDSLTYGTVYDIEGNKYKTVVIGNQVWMAENLKTRKFNDGISIPQVLSVTDWRYTTSPGYCWYDNQIAYKDTKYGALYNWYTVNTGKLCPAGWHVPSDEEWTTLVTFVGGTGVAGGILKEKGTDYWSPPNVGATNTVGFSALPAGVRTDANMYSSLGFQSMATHAYFWSSSQSTLNSNWGFHYSMSYSGSGVNRLEGVLKFIGESVRCVKD